MAIKSNASYLLAAAASGVLASARPCPSCSKLFQGCISPDAKNAYGRVKHSMTPAEKKKVFLQS